MSYYGDGTMAPDDGRRDTRRDGRGGQENRGADRAALVIHTIADIAAAFIGLWIVMYLLDANQANGLVTVVYDVASWLAGWSQDLFTMDPEWLRVVLNYGLPALLYLGIGHGLAIRIRRF